MLSILAVAWLFFSAHAISSQRTTSVGGLSVNVTKLSEKPSQYLVLTNASTAESLIIKAITHPNLDVIAEDEDTSSELMGSRYSNVEYRGEYFRVDTILVDPGLNQNTWGGIVLLGFLALGLCWAVVGLTGRKQGKLDRRDSNEEKHRSVRAGFL